MEVVVTNTTCSFNCWEAVQDFCHCSCGGANHGILRSKDGVQPQKKCLIKGHRYVLQSVSNNWNLLADERDYWILLSGFADIFHLPNDDRRIHRRWSTYEAGTPAYIRYPTPRQVESWPELQHLDKSKRIYLLWLREEKCGEVCFDECPRCEALVERIQQKKMVRDYVRKQ